MGGVSKGHPLFIPCFFLFLYLPHMNKIWKLFFFRVIQVLLPLFILACVEGVLWIAGAGSEIPVFVEDPLNSEYLVLNNRIAERYFLDPAAAPGVSYPSFRKQKPENGLRIVVQGASTVAGIPYKKGGAFPAMLEHRLRIAYPEKEVEVINTGVTAVCSYTLLDLADDIKDIEPDAVIVYAGHNEYYGVLGVGSSQRLGNNSALIRFYHGINKLRLVRLIRKAHGTISARRTADIISRPNATLMERMVKEQMIPMDSDLYDRGLDQFRTNLERLARQYRKGEIPLFICTLVSNEKDMEPFCSATPGDSAAAGTHYALGLESYSRGDYTTAKSHLVQASDLDMLRFRAPSAFNRIIREVASEQEAFLVDVRQEFEACSPFGIIGNELLTEHVHPNIKGYFLITQACVEELASAGIISHWTPERSGSSGLGDMPVTAVDSVYGLIGIRLLKNSWPFVENSTADPGRVHELFTPESHIDSLAYDLFLDKRDWEECMNLLYKHYISKEQYREALKVSSALLIEFPYSAIPYNMAGRIHSEMGNYRKACTELKRGFDKQAMPQLAYNLASNLILSGEAGSAVPYLEFFLKSNADRKDVQEKLLLAKRVQQLEGEMEACPDSTELYIHLAYQYLLLNQRSRADSLVAHAYERDSGNALLHQIFSGSGN